MPNDLETQFQEAMQAGDEEEAWSRYLTAWKANVKIQLTPEEFNTLFYDGEVADQAAALMTKDADLRRHFARFVAQYSTIDLTDADVRRVYTAAVEPDTIIAQWIEQRQSLISARSKKELANSVTRALLEVQGRLWTRRYFATSWAEQDLMEEEKEAVFVALDDGGVLTAEFLHSLGPEAEILAERLFRGGRLSGHVDLNRVRFVISGKRSAEEARHRITSLLQDVVLSADLRDSGIPIPARRFGWDAARVEQLIRRLGRSGSIPRREAESFMATMLYPAAIKPEQQPTVLSFPLIRLLHLQSILSAPSLASALASPEQFLMPETFLYTLGQGGVSYVPELRLDSATDRRWRARWSENTAEAVAVIFMEDCVAVDLSTLARIPETNREPTPDFQAQAVSKEPVVFETKGSTNWETHRRQRNEARAQLRKPVPGINDDAYSGRSWQLGGSAFACSLFAAENGSRRSSLLHVADPPFPFPHLFREGWEDSARRHHYAAVLEACEQYDLADYILRRRPRAETTRQEMDEFNILGGREGWNCVGRYDALDLAARRVGHPAPERFRGIRIFRGLDARLYAALVRIEQMPSLVPFDGPATGTVPGEGGSARGVYSRLADGAVFAVVAE